MANTQSAAYKSLMKLPRARHVSKTSRRFTVICCALQSIRAREIIRIVGRGDHLPQAGEDNAFLNELADIVDEALQKEVERRRTIGTL